MIDADLGGELLEQRVARPGVGRSPGYRTILVSSPGARVVFIFGFAKSDHANLIAHEEAVCKAAAKLVSAFSEYHLDAEVANNRMTEVKCNDPHV